MHLPSGIPTLDNLQKLQQSDLFARHSEFNRQFLDRHQAAMADYSRHWALDQLRLWSRRWEYPFVAQRMTNFAEKGGAPGAEGRIRILDAGSGVTYFPYFVIDQVPQAEFTCCDYDASYVQQFAQINRDRGGPKVEFRQADLRQLPFEDGSYDALCCISVLEHTDNYAKILDEFARVLRPGGLFVLTFDLSLDGKFPLPKSTAAELLGVLRKNFSFPDEFSALAELDRMNADGILTTDHVRAVEPGRLPWTRPARAYKAVKDLLSGRGWTGGFRSLTVFCLDALRR